MGTRAPGGDRSAGACPHGRDLAGHVVHTPSASRDPFRMIQSQNKMQMKMLLITRGYAKQDASIMG